MLMSDIILLLKFYKHCFKKNITKQNTIRKSNLKSVITRNFRNNTKHNPIRKSNLKSVLTRNFRNITKQNSINKSVNKIITKPVNKIISKPVNKPVNNIITKPDNKIITKPDNKIITKPVNKLINKPNSKLINKSISNSNINKFTNLNIKIYILCHNQIILEKSKNMYSKYNWAYPILMKYQDFSFENAFWAQLLEIEPEWINCDMVGILSSKVNMKLNLGFINNILLTMNNNCNFYHFKPSSDPRLVSNKFIPHPNFNIIWRTLLQELKLKDCKEYFCNYWICKPKLMVNFINWYLNIALPIVKKHPLIMSNAEYKEGTLSINQLIELCGVPYYPILPFIIERLNPCYFTNL